MFGFSYAGLVYFGHGRTLDIYVPRGNPDIDGQYKRTYGKDAVPMVPFIPDSGFIRKGINRDGAIQPISMPDVKIYKNDNISSGVFTRLK